ncbi:AraC family transcriptional regulator [Sphingobium sp.]|uniref:AraC family transcriptional regulator n=1 Tax=Sphingobium sp. TaxID=1912891 RepID=UPI002C688F44|nr:AraC family transcriptional regulator [Sphingobium sp.]HUD92937.1 AraC family transcriptional regulator [Sphingobium sp.]
MNRSLASGVFADDILSCLRKAGHAPSSIMPSSPDAPTPLLVPATELAALWRAAATMMDDEFLGLGARPMPSGSFALLCHCVVHAGTLRRALPRALQFLNILLGDPSATLTVESGVASVTLTDAGTDTRPFAHRMYWIILHGLACWLVGRQIPISAIASKDPEPPETSPYREFFGVAVRYGQPCHALAVDRAFLNLPIRRSAAALNLFLRDAPSNIIVRYRPNSDLATKIRADLNRIDPVAWPGSAEIASLMNMSSATMRRQLKAEGATISEIKDGIRKQRAIDALEQGRCTIADLAASLGFEEPSAFYRAFRKWTGRSPRQFTSTKEGRLRAKPPHHRPP